jgi:hypothetical protein
MWTVVKRERDLFPRGVSTDQHRQVDPSPLVSNDLGDDLLGGPIDLFQGVLPIRVPDFWLSWVMSGLNHRGGLSNE